MAKLTNSMEVVMKNTTKNNATKTLESGTKLYKTYRAVVKAVDTEKKTVTAVINTATIDRDGDRVFPVGADLSKYLTHPILLSSHDYRDLQKNIGKALSVTQSDDAIEAEFEYFVGEGNPEADWGFKLAEKGVAAFSIGFITKTAEYNPDTYGFNIYSWEMYEVSQVTVPSNYEALQKMKSAAKEDDIAKDVLKAADEIKNTDKPELEGYEDDDAEGNDEGAQPELELTPEEMGVTPDLASNTELVENIAKALSAKLGKTITIKYPEAPEGEGDTNDEGNTTDEDGEADAAAERPNGQMPASDDEPDPMVLITDEEGKAVAKVAKSDLDKLAALIRIADSALGESLKGFKSIRNK